MFDPWSMISMITYLNIRDYFYDREREKREKLHEYRLCFEKIGDNVATMGSTILSVYSQSRQKESEELIVKGAKQLPLYIFLRILSVQGKSISKHQLKVINMCFNNFTGIGIEREEYLKALTGEGITRRLLEESVGLNEEHCGEFWRNFIKMMYETEMEEESFSGLVNSYAETVYRFALLGDCSAERAEIVYHDFVNGFKKFLKEGIATSAEDADSAEKDAKLHYENMKKLCRRICEVGDEDDELLIDIFDYFAISMVTGMFEKAQMDDFMCVELLQQFFDDIFPGYRYTAEQIYEGFKVSEDARQNFYGLANDWQNINFWMILFIASAKNRMEDTAIDFIQESEQYIKAVEEMLLQRFPSVEIKGTGKLYMDQTNDRIGLYLKNGR